MLLRFNLTNEDICMYMQVNFNDNMAAYNHAWYCPVLSDKTTKKSIAWCACVVRLTWLGHPIASIIEWSPSSVTAVRYLSPRKTVGLHTKTAKLIKTNKWDIIAIYIQIQKESTRLDNIVSHWANDILWAISRHSQSIQSNVDDARLSFLHQLSSDGEL